MVLITLETDGFKMEDEYLQSSLLKHWFTWNKPYEHVKLSALPIGLNHDRHVDMLQNFLNKELVHHPSKLLLVNFDVKTNPIRYKLLRKALEEWKDFSDTTPYLKENKLYYTNRILMDNWV